MRHHCINPAVAGLIAQAKTGRRGLAMKDG
jgi:hypothetical protein